MNKKYTLKVKTPAEKPTNISSVSSAEQPEVKSGGLRSFLKFLALVAVIAAIVIPLSPKFKIAYHEKLGEEIYRQASEIGVLHSFNYYPEYDAYVVEFKLPNVQPTLRAAKAGGADAEKRWNNFVIEIVKWNYNIYNYLNGRLSNAWCYVTVYDEDMNEILESRNGILTNNALN